MGSDLESLKRHLSSLLDTEGTRCIHLAVLKQDISCVGTRALPEKSGHIRITMDSFVSYFPGRRLAEMCALPGR